MQEDIADAETLQSFEGKAESISSPIKATFAVEFAMPNVFALIIRNMHPISNTEPFNQPTYNSATGPTQTHGQQMNIMKTMSKVNTMSTSVSISISPLKQTPNTSPSSSSPMKAHKQRRQPRRARRVSVPRAWRKRIHKWARECRRRHVARACRRQCRRLRRIVPSVAHRSNASCVCSRLFCYIQSIQSFRVGKE